MKKTPLQFDFDGLSHGKLLQTLRSYQRAINGNIISSITDAKGKIIYANKNFCEITKYAAKELLGQDHRIINSCFHPKSFFENLWKTIENGNIWQGEIKNRAKDGTCYWVNTVIISIKDENEKIIQYLSLRVLINDKKQAEKDKIDYVKSLEDLLYKTSHEVRQPIVHILGISKLLERPINSPDDLKKIIEYMKSSIQSLDKFTRELTAHLHVLKEKGKIK